MNAIPRTARVVEIRESMCLVLPARVLSVDGERAEIEQHGGARAMVSCALRPDIAAGDYVLVDRGLIIERIEAEEASAIIQMYAEIGDLLQAADEAVAFDPRMVDAHQPST